MPADDGSPTTAAMVATVGASLLLIAAVASAVIMHLGHFLLSVGSSWGGASGVERRARCRTFDLVLVLYGGVPHPG